MRIAVTYDAGAGAATPDAAAALQAVGAVVASLNRLRYPAVPLPLGRPLTGIIARLAAVDVIANLTEGLEGRGEDEPRIAALQELAGRPMDRCAVGHAGSGPPKGPCERPPRRTRAAGAARR